MALAKAEWGSKHTCAECGAKFYDMMRTPTACPACGTVVDVAALVKPRRTAPTAAKTPEPSKAAEVDDNKIVDGERSEDIDLEDGDDATLDESTDDDSEGDDLIEDASELGEDEHDMAEVLEGTVEDEDTDER